MNKNSAENIEKSNLDKLVEFFHSIRIVFDSKELIYKGRYYQITPIYGQLRALLTDSTKRKEEKPLFEIAGLLGEEIKIFYVPTNFDSLNDGSFFNISSLPISVQKQYTNQVEIPLKEYLNLEVIKYNGRRLKTYELINTLSNKYGGSHYDTAVPDYMSEILSFGINNQPVLDNYIMQVADLFIDISLNLVKKLSDFDYFITLYFETLDKEENIIFDYILPETNCRMVLATSRRKFNLLISDLIGRKVNFELNEIIISNKLLLFEITHRITNKLKSEVKVLINGKIVLEELLDEPMLIVNEFNQYCFSLNKSHEGTEQNFEFGARSIKMFGGILPDEERWSLYNSFKITNKNEIMWLGKNSYAFCVPGNTNVNTEGKVTYNKPINPNCD